MTRITTGCPRCGRVELETSDVVLVRSPHEGLAWYQFDCGGCAQRVVKPAPASVAVALAGVRVRVWTVPAEFLEREGLDAQPPLGMDDLLDLLLALRAGPDPASALTTPTTGGAGSRPARPSAA